MLEDSLFESRGSRRTRKPVTLVIAAVAHVVTIGVLVLIPLLETQALPLPPVNMPLWVPRPVELKSIPVFSRHSHASSQLPTETVPSFTEPQAIPDKIAIVDEPPRALVGFLPSVGDVKNPLLSIGSGPGIPGPGGPPTVAPPTPPPPPPVPSFKATPFRTGGDVQAANLIHQVNPVYPALARQTRIQGVVVMEAVISKDGSVDKLRVLSGHPFLSQAAIDAVKQWKYRPTMLNGEPVDVITTITVSFTLR